MNSNIRVGVFYDGVFFNHVTSYFNFVHPKRAKLDIYKIHNLIRDRASSLHGVDIRRCQIVGGHYFKGRALEATHEQMYWDRCFDDLLQKAGVTTHYITTNAEGREKGIDVLLALEAYEGAFRRQYDVIALFAGDSDFVPLIRKLAAIGIETIVIGANVINGDKHTRVSTILQNTAALSVLLDRTIDDQHDAFGSDILLEKRYSSQGYQDNLSENEDVSTNIVNINEQNIEIQIERKAINDKSYYTKSAEKIVGVVTMYGYNFSLITCAENKTYFTSPDRMSSEQSYIELVEGDTIEFCVGQNNKGLTANNVRKLC